jgi:uncharacterized RDD family membrane protein YckC
MSDQAPGVGAAQSEWATNAERPETPVPGAPHLRYADTAARLVAYVIDVGIMLVAATLAFVVLEPSTGLQEAVFSIAWLGWSLGYFVLFWSGGRRATPGQRLFKIQVGNASNGAPLNVSQAVKRWFAMGDVLSLVGLIPGLANGGTTLVVIWAIVLMVSIVRHPSKRGIHDLFAGSAVVRPIEGSRGTVSGIVVAALVIAIIPLLAIIALIFLGSQVNSVR